MKILLIGANALRLDDGRRWHETHAKGAYAATTLTTLAALVPRELNAEIELVDEAVDPVPDDFRGADLVGISAMTCDAQRAYQLAGMARARNIAVVLGGIIRPSCRKKRANMPMQSSEDSPRPPGLNYYGILRAVQCGESTSRPGRTPSYPACRFPSATC